MHRKACVVLGVADTAVVSATTTTPRGADWAPRSRACIVQGAPRDPAPWDSWCGCPLRVPEIQGLAGQPLRWHGRSHGTHNHRRDAGIMTPSHQHERQSHQVAPRNAQLSHLGVRGAASPGCLENAARRERARRSPGRLLLDGPARSTITPPAPGTAAACATLGPGDDSLIPVIRGAVVRSANLAFLNTGCTRWQVGPCFLSVSRGGS
jgi:hypothetical protein